MTSNGSLDAIPAALRERQQWVLWQQRERNGETSKVPIGRVNDPSTWAAFQVAVDQLGRGEYSGLGFVFSHYDDFIGIDLDGCRNPDTGEIASWAGEILHRLDSYSEISPSQTGVKVWVRGKMPFERGKKATIEGAPSVCSKTPGIELYAAGRYFAVTGQRLDDYSPDVEQRQDAINWLASQFWRQRSTPKPTRPKSHLPDRNKIIERARKYIATKPGAISGQRGHDTTFDVACSLVAGFELSEDEAMDLIREWNQTCEPPWTEAELKHKIQDAAQVPERGRLLNQSVPDAIRDGGERKNGDDQPAERFEFKGITSQELATTDFQLEYLIEGLLVKGQPAIMAGPKKCLKTTLAIYLGMCMSIGRKVFDRFDVQRPIRVGLLSGESGEATIQETAARIAQSWGWSLSGFDNMVWGFQVPVLQRDDHLRSLERFISDNGLEAVILDPTYMMLDGADASNLFAMGAQLRRLTDVGQATGASMMPCHHTKRGVVDPFSPPELEDIAWAGFQEWARQWILVGRREKYDPEQGGEHKLWLNAGGSAGHSALVALDISEGTRQDPDGRHWRIQAMAASEARARAAAEREDSAAERREQKEQEAMERNRDKIIKALRKYPDGETTKVVRDTAKLSGQRFTPILSDLVDEGVVEHIQIEKSNRKFDAIKLNVDVYGTSGTSGTNPGSPGCPDGERTGVGQTPPLGGCSPSPASPTTTNPIPTSEDLGF